MIGHENAKDRFPVYSICVFLKFHFLCEVATSPLHSVVGWLVFILLFLDHSSCLDISILKYLHTRIRESILLNSYFSRAIRQSPYQSKVLAVISKCIYRPSVV